MNKTSIPWIEKYRPKNFESIVLSDHNKTILEKNPSLINWKELSRNKKAIKILETRLDKLDWQLLSSNPCAIKLLEQNQDKILWKHISLNENIFELDYYLIKKRIEPFVEELMMVCFHPSRLEYYIEKYNYDIGDDTYMDDDFIY